MARTYESFGGIIKNISVPSGMGSEELDKFVYNGFLIFTNVTFTNCRFNFTCLESYVFVHCQFIGCDVSTLKKDRLVECDTDLDSVGLRGFNCPPTGAFEAWKVCADVWTNEMVLAKLFIPEYALRVTVPFSRKFRVSVAHVKGLYFADGSESKRAFSVYDPTFTYEPNAELLPEGEWVQNNAYCAAGIHAFTDPYDAIDYGRLMLGYNRQTFIDNRRRNKDGKLEIVHREDGSCPYPLRMAPGFPSGEWEWVDKLLLGKEGN